MKRILTPTAVKNYVQAPPSIRKAFDKQIKLLLENLHHPSLRAKKNNEGDDLWQARVNRDWRFYFQIENDTYTIVAITPHPK